MLTGDLYGALVIGTGGAKLGRLTEVYVTDGEVRWIGIGARNFLGRLFGRNRGHRIAWEKVERIAGGRIIVDHAPF